jgi:hypothetical protein
MNAHVLVALIVPVGGSVSSSLFVISCHHFREKMGIQKSFLKPVLYIFSVLNVMIRLFIYEADLLIMQTIRTVPISNVYFCSGVTGCKECIVVTHREQNMDIISH